jgi:4a-hydroxytetrahydrobiopterin dehydratase
MLSQLRGWSIERSSGHLQLAKRFEFRGFAPGVALVDLMAPIAEAEGHHPDLLLTYGHLEAKLWTHVAGGLTINDFILAARFDAAIRQDF